MIYLASPYTHKDPEIVQARYEAVRKHTAWMLSQSIWVYSPIVHCHDLAISHKLPTDSQFWQAYNFHMIDLADELQVLKLEGYEQSIGIMGEVGKANSILCPVTYVEPHDYIFS